MVYEDGKIINGYLDNNIKKEIKYYKEVNIEEDDKNELDNFQMNENELKEFIKSIDLKKQFCQLHKNLIIGLCIDTDCKEKNKLLCQKCLFKNHKKHDIIEIEEYEDKFKENIIKEEKNIIELKNINNRKKIDQISKLKKAINELVDIKFESFISSIFTKIINGKENSLNQKLIKLKQNYPIDNLDKEEGITNLIFSSINKNSDDNTNECFNNILNANIKNISKEIENIFSVVFDNNNSNIFEIDNYWTKEIINSENSSFNYELEENDYLAKKINRDFQIIKSNLELKEGNIYLIIFNIIYQDKDNYFDIGFVNNEFLKANELENDNIGVCISNKGLFIDGKIVNEDIKIENMMIFVLFYY